MAKLAPARSSVDCGLARRATRLSSSFPFPSRARQVARAKVPDSPCAAASQRGGQPTRRRAHAPRRPAPSRGLPPARTQASACGCVSWPSAPPRLARPSLARPTSARTPLRGPALRPLPPSRASGLPCPPRARSSRLAHRDSVPSCYKAHQLVRAAAATQAPTASLRPGVYAELAPTSAAASSEHLAALVFDEVSSLFVLFLCPSLSPSPFCDVTQRCAAGPANVTGRRGRGPAQGPSRTQPWHSPCGSLV
jgi:hypothetical protein